MIKQLYLGRVFLFCGTLTSQASFAQSLGDNYEDDLINTIDLIVSRISVVGSLFEPMMILTLGDCISDSYGNLDTLKTTLLADKSIVTF